jgi:glycosyltransferase involved in cell wall biosynthesis
MLVKFSIIIPTHNRAEILERCLQCICELENPDEDWEVLVLNNNSTDSTEEIVNSYRERLPNLRYLITTDPGLHVGRNLGWEKAKGDVLCYIDDDSFVSKGWLKGVEKAFGEPDVGLVGGPCLPQYEAEPPIWINKFWSDTDRGKCFGSLSLLDFGDQISQISPYYVYGCNFNIRKDVLLKLGGFHPDAMPRELIRYRGDGETFVSKRLIELAHKALYNPDVKIYHFVSVSRMTTKYFQHRSYMQGISDSFAKIRKETEMDNEGRFAENKGNSLTKNVINRIKRQIKAFGKAGKRLESEDIRKIEEMLKESYKKGFNYHQEEVRKDPKLLEWVLRKNYLGENGKLSE